MRCKLLRAVWIGCLCLASLGLCGCGLSAASATLGTSLGLLGAGVATEAATHTSAEITVEVYDPGGNGPGHDFQLDSVLAIRRVINSAVTSRLIDIAQRCEPLVEEVDDNIPVFRSYAAIMTGQPDPNAKAVGADFGEVADRVVLIDRAWQKFREAARKVAEDRESGKDLPRANDTLREFRRALSDLRDFKLNAVFIDLIINQMGVGILRETVGEPIEDLNTRLNSITSFAGDTTGETFERLQEIFDSARELFKDSPKAIKGINDYAEYILVPFQSLAEVNSDADAAISATLDGITSSVNIGPINNEVTQILLTPGRILGQIADPGNKSHWKKLPSVSAGGGPGNNNIIFYMENQGTPILKSANFDPTQFIVANGAIYKQAFSVLAGVAKGNATSTDGTGSGSTGNSGGGKAKKSPAPAGGGTTKKNSSAAKPAAESDGKSTVKAAPSSDATQKQLNAIIKTETATLDDIATQAQTIVKSKNGGAGGKVTVKDAIEAAAKAITADAAKITNAAKPAKGG